jgi:tetratricopeptide (TPR) repeat protein
VNTVRGWIRFFAVVGMAGLLIWSVRWGGAYWAQKSAEMQLSKGYAVLAAENLESVRDRLVGSARGCGTLVSAYFGARNSERLEWAAQACLDGGVETPEVYLGLAAAKELSGRDSEAIELLGQIAARYDRSPDAYYRMAKIYRRLNDGARAAEATFRAAERTDLGQVKMEALELLSKQDRWNDARKMAEALRAMTIENPEAKLAIARALLRGGNKEGSLAVANEARVLLEKNPDTKARLEIAYADVLPAIKRN